MRQAKKNRKEGINKLIGDFFTGTFNSQSGFPYFVVNSSGLGADCRQQPDHPEPEEYTIVFGLFALGFVFFYRKI